MSIVPADLNAPCLHSHAMLEAIQLDCRRGERRLFSQLDLRLEPGVVLHVRGANGSGKTTLLRTLCGLFTPEAGEVRWHGEPIQRLAEDYHRELLFSGHRSGVKDELTALENLDMALILGGEGASLGARREALAQFGLRDLDDLPVRMLSQGQRRRVALARLVLTRRPLWILDEPFTALDADAVRLLTGLLAAHIARGGLAVLTTHQPVALPPRQVVDLTLGG